MMCAEAPGVGPTSSIEWRSRLELLNAKRSCRFPRPGTMAKLLAQRMKGTWYSPESQRVLGPRDRLASQTMASALIAGGHHPVQCGRGTDFEFERTDNDEDRQANRHDDRQRQQGDGEQQVPELEHTEQGDIADPREAEDVEG